MTQNIMPPRYHFRPDMPSLRAVISRGVSDAYSTIPAVILTEPAVQLTGGQYGAPLIVADPELARTIPIAE